MTTKLLFLVPLLMLGQSAFAQDKTKPAPKPAIVQQSKTKAADFAQSEHQTLECGPTLYCGPPSGSTVFVVTASVAPQAIKSFELTVFPSAEWYGEVRRHDSGSVTTIPSVLAAVKPESVLTFHTEDGKTVSATVAEIVQMLQIKRSIEVK